MASVAKKTQKTERASSVLSRLKPYHKKRSFDRTPEPRGGEVPKSSAASLGFVVQKHAATRLHYDFRLEHEGVLLSWSVPKGPSLKPGERRLAVRTEDHPLDYRDFEGVIPKGEYGGGTVIVWDRGTWQPEGNASDALKKGRLTFELQGDKLHGRFHLVRTPLDASKRENWLLFKGRDEASNEDLDIVSERPESALSGRTIEEVASAPSRVWHSNKPAVKSKTAPAKGKAGSVAVAKSKTRPTLPQAGSAQEDVIALVKRLPVDFALTNLDKVLFAAQHIRKAELLAYYASIAELMLPHVEGRPLTLVRCPSGQSSKCFYQKHATEGVPAAVQRFDIDEDGKPATYMFIRDMPGLIALAQMGVLEVHTWPCHADKVERPDQFVFDIDPDEGLSWDRSVQAALELRERLSKLGLESFVKTTGGKGLHVVLPVTRKLDWETHKAFARAVVVAMAADQPKLYLTNMRKSLRKGKIFLDYLRNGRGATAVAPYSTRSHPQATVATPISWEELSEGVRPEQFTVPSLISRMERPIPDPWEDYPKLRQAVTAAALRSLKVKH